MKRIRAHVLLPAAVAALSLCGCKDELASGFASPPESMTTGVYWYWINDNISKEGVVKDLQAMKKAGVNSAFIGNIGDQPTAYGQTKLLSDEWWEVLHAAMKTAGELGIEIGMFNCPGWSQSGGPWIKAEQSMRHLASTETLVAGGGKVSVKLPAPSRLSHYKAWSGEYVNLEGRCDEFQDVKTLAIPVPDDYRLNLLDVPGAKVTTSNMRSPQNTPVSSPSLDTLPTSPRRAKYVAPEGEEASITVKLPKAYAARSLVIYPAGACSGTGELQAKVNGAFVPVATCPLRSSVSPFIGFTPFTPIVAGFEKVSSDEYRIVFRTGSNVAIGKIALSPTAMLDKYPEKTLAYLYQGANPPWTEYKWTSMLDVPAANDSETAIPPATVVDVTDKVQPDGTLVWDAPGGTWLVLRMGMLPNGVLVAPVSPEGDGYEMDKLNPAFIRHHFDSFIGEVLRRIPAKDRKTFRVVVMDSWEKGGQDFTDNFIDSLRARYGYDPTPFLPVLTGYLVGSPEQAERFLWDVRRLASEMISSSIAHFNSIFHRHGLYSWIENYGDWGFPAEPLLYGKHTDRVGGEFWPGGDYFRYIDIAASCAHIYNKPRVYAEAFTSMSGNYHYPYSLKQEGDRALAAGMTSCVLHVYIQQAYEDRYPGVESWFGVEFNRKNTWFPHIDLFTAYLKRCGFMLEQGLPVADVAYFIGEDVPVNTGPFGLNPSAAKDGVSVPALPNGYHADYVNADVIINAMSVKDGRIVLPHGISYRLLALPPFKTMRPEVLKGIERLVAEGATVLGEAPQRSPSYQGYPNADAELTALASKMWGDKNARKRPYGKGLILSGMTIAEALSALGIAPDVKTSGSIAYAHRTTPSREIYFIANQSDNTVQLSPQFRVAGKQPELWNPVSGRRRLLPAFELNESSTTVPLQLEPRESAFIVFAGKGTPKSSELSDNFPKLTTLAEVSTPWTVTFESDNVRRGPSEPATFDRLQSWSQSDDARIRYYSGTAVYRNTLTLDAKPAGNVYIDLGKVGVMAKVKINGKYCGGAWTYPYRVDATGALKAGENTLEVEVVNTWANRFIGEASLPQEAKIVKPLYNNWNASSALQESGLLEPVKVVQINHAN
ncbi:MAG: glycoside hydrolase family 2 [Prevotellaceae bacterium]|nr:glycoside hydrolase family 2 [Prevotellaceae bacterium]